MRAVVDVDGQAGVAAVEIVEQRASGIAAQAIPLAHSALQAANE